MMLRNRAALVTGAAGLLGRAIVATLRAEGARVVAVDIDAVKLRELAAAEPGVATLDGDLTREADVDRVVAQADAEAGRIDVLVNCAGKYRNCPIVEMGLDEWEGQIAQNLTTTMLMCRAYGRRWPRQGVKGVIVNISSGAGTSARAGSGHYAAAKAGVNMLTHVLAIEFGRLGIRVNAVAPGVVLERIVTEQSPDNHPYINMSLQGIPLGRTGRPQDIADAVAFLASDRSQWIQGVILEADGGAHCGRTHVPLTFGADFKRAPA